MVNMAVCKELCKENVEVYSVTGSTTIHVVKAFNSKQGKMSASTCKRCDTIHGMGKWPTVYKTWNICQRVMHFASKCYSFPVPNRSLYSSLRLRPVVKVPMGE